MGQNAPSQMDSTSVDAGSNPMLKLLKGGLGGLGQGLQNQAQIPQGGAQMGPIPQAQQVSADYFQPQYQQNNPIQRPIRGNNLAFYGSANG